MSQEDWRTDIADVIAREVRRYRKERKLSAQQLSDRCAQLGMDIPRAVLANLENGRRPAVSVAELIILARALDVPPVLLIAPVGRQHTMEVLPGRKVDVFTAMEWLSGLVGLADKDEAGEISLVSRPFPPDANAATLFRDSAAQARRLSAALTALDKTLKATYEAKDPAQKAAGKRDVERLVELVEQGYAYLRMAAAQIAERGLIPPIEEGELDFSNLLTMAVEHMTVPLGTLIDHFKNPPPGIFTLLPGSSPTAESAPTAGESDPLLPHSACGNPRSDLDCHTPSAHWWHT